MTYGIPGTSIVDAIILNKVKDVTGGQIFWSMYGGSGLSEETQRFICRTICPVASGYGLTESSAYVPPFVKSEFAGWERFPILVHGITDKVAR